MKNIFRKNQVIITALAIMIAVAGYLNFTGDKVPKANVGVDDYAAADTGTTAVDVDSIKSSADIAEGNDALAATENDEYASDDLTAETEATTKDAKAADKTKEDTTATDNDETKEVSDKISDEDVTSKTDDSMAVTDTGELAAQTESDDTTGEAVLVNSTINNSFFSSSKLKREQTRAKNKELLMGLVDDKNITEKQKQDAVQSILNMATIADKENVTETVLEAKGFSSVVTIIDDTVNVIVNATNLTDQDRAVIENAVKKNTGITVDHITITPVEVE